MMAEYTNIGWCNHTANLWWGCQEVHDGCDHCYAREFARLKGRGDAWEGVRYACQGVWDALAKWDSKAAKAGAPAWVFCGSMMDIFEKSLPAVDWHGRPLGLTTGDLRKRLFTKVIPSTPNLLYQLLTKRPGNAPKMVPPWWLTNQPANWPVNVIVGASVVDQPTADTLMPQLCRLPRVFVSYEPALGPVDFRPWLDRLAWLIVGAESGPNRRSFDPAWARSAVDQCRAAGVPVFVKQGSHRWSGRQGNLPAELWGIHEMPEVAA